MLTKDGLYPTSIDIPLDARAALLPLLNRRLADMLDLFNQTKHAHWNVKGPNFIALHELFDHIAERVEEHCDLLAERVVALGGTAEGTTRQSAAASSLGEYDLEAVDGERHVLALARQIAAAAKSVRGPSRNRRNVAIPRPPICSRRSRGPWTRTCGFSRPTRPRKH